MPPSSRSMVPGFLSPSRSQTCERAALHELHREVRNAVGIDRELVYRHDVRVLQLPGDLPFRDEAVAIEGFGRIVLVETFERHLAEEVAIGRRVDVTQSASRELARYAEMGRRVGIFFPRDGLRGQVGRAGDFGI